MTNTKIEKLQRALTWRLDVASGEMIEAPNYTRTHLSFGRVSQNDLDWICEVSNRVFKDADSQLRIDNAMGELIPCKVRSN